jgi:hypothetical protein
MALLPKSDFYYMDIQFGFSSELIRFPSCAAPLPGQPGHCSRVGAGYACQQAGGYPTFLGMSLVLTDSACRQTKAGRGLHSVSPLCYDDTPSFSTARGGLRCMPNGHPLTSLLLFLSSLLFLFVNSDLFLHLVRTSLLALRSDRAKARAPRRRF